MKKNLTPAFLIVAMLLLTSSASWAKKEGHGHGQDKVHNHNIDQAADVNVSINIGSTDRKIIRQYIVDDYRSNCPPGLAKKHNGCMPPGQAKKRYHVGHVLPQDVVWEPIPQPLLVKLRPAPVGYRYVRVDTDVLLIAEASHKVIDAITLLSAVGN
ncbi:MAG: RcnB family protein [Alphaproteobacteria bacterium]